MNNNPYRVETRQCWQKTAHGPHIWTERRDLPCINFSCNGITPPTVEEAKAMLTAACKAEGMAQNEINNILWGIGNAVSSVADDDTKWQVGLAAMAWIWSNRNLPLDDWMYPTSPPPYPKV